MTDALGDRTEMSSDEYRAYLAGQGQTLFVPLLTEEVAPEWTTSEKAFQAKVVSYAVAHGWDDPKPYHTFNSASSEPGFCDLVMARVGANGVGRLVIAELKVPGGRVTNAQRRWLDTLATVPGTEVYLWYPDDWDDITQVLN